VCVNPGCCHGAQGTLVKAFAAFGLLLDDDSIDLISVTVDRWPDESRD
jgi:hypothetical protein